MTMPITTLPARRPSPPPLTGIAEELGDLANGDFYTFHTLLNQRGYVVLDYETTGLDAGNRPVQVGALKVRGGHERDWLNLYMDPGEPLGDWSRTHLRNRDGQPLTDQWLATQPSMGAAHARLVEFLGDDIVVAHHLPFDGEVLDWSLRQCGIDWDMAGGLDTKAFFAAAVPPGEFAPPGYHLAELTEFFGVDLGDGHHDAIYDAVATHEMLQRGLQYAASHGDPSVLDGQVQRVKFINELRSYLWANRRMWAASLGSQTSGAKQ